MRSPRAQIPEPLAAATEELLAIGLKHLLPLTDGPRWAGTGHV